MLEGPRWFELSFGGLYRVILWGQGFPFLPSLKQAGLLLLVVMTMPCFGGLASLLCLWFLYSEFCLKGVSGFSFSVFIFSEGQEERSGRHFP